MINIIAAVSLNNCIGIDGKIPWNIKEDMKFFKTITTGKTVIMGSKTYQSIGKPLPNRNNIVISSKNIEEITTFNNLNDAIKSTNDEIFLIGGSRIYLEGMKCADKLYITLVNKEVNGDTFFPFINPLFKVNEKRFLSEEATLIEYIK